MNSEHRSEAAGAGIRRHRFRGAYDEEQNAERNAMSEEEARFLSDPELVAEVERRRDPARSKVTRSY
jgi:hypothetical protein